MKKVSMILATMLFLLATVSLNAQSKSTADYFAGKWGVLVKGTPNGDSKMTLVLEKKDLLLSGVVQDTVGIEIAKLDKIDINAQPNSITVYFNSHGFDVNIELNKKDEDHVTGSLMGMFDTEGARLKEE